MVHLLESIALGEGWQAVGLKRGHQKSPRILLGECAAVKNGGVHLHPIDSESEQQSRFADLAAGERSPNDSGVHDRSLLKISMINGEPVPRSRSLQGSGWLMLDMFLILNTNIQY
jgi:hypothetical protein